MTASAPGPRPPRPRPPRPRPPRPGPSRAGPPRPGPSRAGPPRTGLPRTGLPRAAARLVFRHHIENGLSVAVCLAAVGLVAGLAFGLRPAVLAGTGALCISIVDQPGRLAGKAAVFLAALLANGAITLLAGLADGAPWLLALLIAAMSAGFALATVYGRPALTLGIAGVLSLVLGMASPEESRAELLEHVALFCGGGALYALLGLAAAWLLDGRNRRLFLNEALLAFAAFLSARARGYDGTVPLPAALRGVVETHGLLMERLQAARDMIFTGRTTARRRKWVGAMLALLDAYEAVLSSDADWETLPRAAAGPALREVAALTEAMARDVEALALALVAPAAPPPACDHVAALARLDAELARLAAERGGDRGGAGGADVAASLRPTRDKLAEAVQRIRRLADSLSGQAAAPETPSDLDLAAFVQVQDRRLATLRGHLSRHSPVMRYAIRLTLAMLAAYAVTLALPQVVHGGWVLLTVALIMRASYALTVQRRNDRILGTLAGCAVAAALIPALPEPALLAAMVLGAGIAHAHATVDYRVASFAASVMALLLLHVLEPQAVLIVDRIVDTLIGAGLSVVFSRLLPSWERRDLPRLVARLIEADRAFAAEALSPRPPGQAYRLARKRALDGFTALATTTRRLSGEPAVGARRLAGLSALLGANYLFVSDLASVRAFLRLRGGEIAEATSGSLLDEARARVLETLAPDRPTPAEPETAWRFGWTEMPTADALAFLRRRLRHIEFAAHRLTTLADRVIR